MPADEPNAPASSPLDSLRVARYDFGSEVARGAFGIVWAGRDLRLQRAVAIKTIIDPGDAALAAQNRRRFLLEARVLGRLQHPNIVPIHDLALRDDGSVFYAMKFVKGATLREVLHKLRDGDAKTIREFPLTRLLTVFQKVCDAIAFAHARGVLHRDLKPANLMLGDFGSVHVMDWGLAKVMNPAEGQATRVPDLVASPKEDGDSHSSSLRRAGAADMTMDGALIGTPTFMSPEQAQGRVHELDERTDIFTLGAILYNILTLRLPVPGNSVDEVLSNAATAHIPPPIFFNKAGGLGEDDSVIAAARLPHTPDGLVPEPLSAVAMKALAPKPGDRYQTVGDLQADVAAYLAGRTTRAENASLGRQLKLATRRHKPRFIAGVVAFVAFNAVVFFFLWQLIASERRTTHALDRAQKAHAELRRAEPLLQGEALSLIQQRRFEDALDKLNFLALTSPKSAAYAALQGNVLQSLQRFGEAKAAYARALELDPAHTAARENLRLSEDLLSLQADDGTLPDSAVKLLGNAMKKQGRFAESVALLKEAGGSNEQLFEQWKAALQKAGLTGAPLATLKMDGTGGLVLDLTGASWTNLQPLAGMPFRRLQLNGNKISDLRPLAGMPLVQLGLAYTDITDLAPLSGSPLTNLSVLHTKVVDLSPLKGVPLQSLNAEYTMISDLRPLVGMNLSALHVGYTKVADLTPLAGMPLKTLSLREAPVSDLAPLKGMALENLNVIGTKVADLAPLQGMPLWRLAISNSKVRDLSVLAGLPLTEAHLGGLDVRNLSMLRAKPLVWMSLDKNTGLTDISALRGMPLKTLWLNATKVSDFTPLLGCPGLEQLLIPSGTPGIEVLRRHPALKRINFTGSKNAEGEWTDLPTPEKFWADYDAQKKGAKK